MCVFQSPQKLFLQLFSHCLIISRAGKKSTVDSRWDDPKSCHYQWSGLSKGLTNNTHPSWAVGSNQRFGTFLKRHSAPVSSETPKAGKPWKTAVGDNRRIISLVSWPDQEHSLDQCVCVCLCLHHTVSGYRWFSTRYEPLTSLKNRPEQRVKTSFQSRNNIIWTVETNQSCVFSLVLTCTTLVHSVEISRTSAVAHSGALCGEKADSEFVLWN